jgi:hypothetical protein
MLFHFRIFMMAESFVYIPYAQMSSGVASGLKSALLLSSAEREEFIGLHKGVLNWTRGFRALPPSQLK